MSVEFLYVPFSGFYCSVHDQECDHQIENLFTGSDGVLNDDLYNSFLYHFNNWRDVFNEYAKAYVESMGDEFEIDSLKLHAIESPRCYNFTTDRLLATISEADFKRIAKTVFRQYHPFLVEYVRKHFTSCDGFISFYSGDLAEWGELSQWDTNQRGALFAVYIEQSHMRGDFDQYAEHCLVDNWLGNGGLYSAILQNADAKALQCLRVFDYLNERKARQL